MRIGVVVLTFRCGAAVSATLASVSASTVRPDALLVVDNSSGDDTLAAVARLAPSAQVIELPGNDGYGPAMNAGVRSLAEQGVEVVVCLTHDAVLDPDCLAALQIAFGEVPELGAAGPVLHRVSAPERVWSAGGVLSGPRRGPRHLLREPTEQLRDAEWLDGAVLAVRVAAFEQVGGFREDLFLYWEDVDVCRRLRENGWQVAVVGSARAAQEPSWTPPYLMARNKWRVLRSRVPAALLLSDTVASALRDLLRRQRTESGRLAGWLRLRGLYDGVTGRLDRSLALDRSTPRDPARIRLLNPLPSTLAHYERQLTDVLAAAGVRASSGASPSIEVQGRRRARTVTAVRLLVGRRFGRNDGVTLVLWPAFGRLDSMTWPRRRSVSLVIHDPEPLRAQPGMGRLATVLGRRAATTRARPIVHGATAREALLDRGWPEPVLLPHPILSPAHMAGPAASPGRRGVVVLGQWKPARSMAALTALAAEPEWDGRREVMGRGWPPVLGWEVSDRFLEEDELDAALRGAACLVLPYDRYFQSNVAVRALETLTPVAGQRHPFLEQLLGPDWPGLVAGDDWAGAVRRAEKVPEQDMVALRERAWRHSVEAWRAWTRSAFDVDGGTRG